MKQIIQKVQILVEKKNNNYTDINKPHKGERNGKGKGKFMYNHFLF